MFIAFVLAALPPERMKKKRIAGINATNLHDLRGRTAKCSFSPAAGRKETFISVVLAALPPKQPKKMVISTLPQAETPVMARSTTPTA
jgi:hypothetical protein